MHPEIWTKFWRIRCGESRSSARARRCPWFAWCKSLLEIMYWKQSTLNWAVFKTRGGWWLWGILRGIEGLISTYINVQLHRTHWAIENIPWRRLKASCCRRLVCAQIVSFEIENLANIDAVVNVCCPWNRRLKFAGPQVWILIVMVSSANPSNQSNYPSPSWRCWMSFVNPKMVWSLWSQHHRGPKMWKNNSSEMGMDQNLWNTIFFGAHNHTTSAILVWKRRGFHAWPRSQFALAVPRIEVPGCPRVSHCFADLPRNAGAQKTNLDTDARLYYPVRRKLARYGYAYSWHHIPYWLGSQAATTKSFPTTW